MFIIVQVNEDAKIITGPLVKEVEESSLFSTLFDSVFSGNYFHQNVRVEVRKTETGPWVPVQEGLQGKLLLMKTLEFIYLKYILLLCDFVVPLSQIHILNAFTRLMDFRYQLPAQKREDIRDILLYNHIIQLFQSMCVGWPGNDHNTCGKKFIERLTKAIWYIDPHLEKLRSRGCHLPLLFSSLPVYQQNGVYNEYYQRMKKKKSQLTRLELFQLANSIELSLAEPWASKDFWQEVVLNVFELTSMMKKYFDHLDNTNNNMKALHESENPAREPSTNCNVRLISKCDEREIDSRYHSLDSDLTNRELFDFIDLNLYVPDDPIKKHDFIHNIQLSVLTGLYR
ncbi:21346_t:CDS:1 [Rhizophagus irregularis]|nr:21346_t:CDS:1 [Rhizophagus irregularis]